MKGFGTLITIIMFILCVVIFLGACCLGTFVAPELWMKIACFVISVLMTSGISGFLVAVAFAMNNINTLKKNLEK